MGEGKLPRKKVVFKGTRVNKNNNNNNKS